MDNNKIIQNQMSNFGWKEGNGLGKDQQGIKEAIKISLKNNKHGLGLDLSEQFVFHWWDHAFNKVASSIVVENSDGEVSISKKKNAKETGRVSSKRPTSIGSGKELLYGRFIRSGMTVVGNKTVEAEDSESSAEDCNEEETRDFSNKNTLERAFKISGGRTGHTAARHGHKLSGKLKRLYDQENEACFASKKKMSFETQATVDKNRIEWGIESIEEKSNVTASKKMKKSGSSNDIPSINESSLLSIEKLHPTEKRKLCVANCSSVMIHGSTSANQVLSVTAGTFSSSDRNIGQCCKKRQKTANKLDNGMKKYSNESSQIVVENKLDDAGIVQLDRSKAKKVKKKQKKRKTKAKSLCTNDA